MFFNFRLSITFKFTVACYERLNLIGGRVEELSSEAT